MEKENYEKSVLEYEDVQEAIAYARELAAKEAYGKGMEKGMEKGMKEGMEKGMEKGIEQTKFLIALNMLKSGMDIVTIASVTGLTEEEILKIKE